MKLLLTKIRVHLALIFAPRLLDEDYNLDQRILALDFVLAMKGMQQSEDTPEWSIFAATNSPGIGIRRNGPDTSTMAYLTPECLWALGVQKQALRCTRGVIAFLRREQQLQRGVHLVAGVPIYFPSGGSAEGLLYNWSSVARYLAEQ